MQKADEEETNSQDIGNLKCKDSETETLAYFSSRKEAGGEEGW